MGSPMALLYYKQEFGSDLIKDYANMPLGGLSGVVLMQVTWAMAKAASDKPRLFPSFETWVASLNSFDTSDGPRFLDPLTEEIGRGFFRYRYEEDHKTKANQP